MRQDNPFAPPPVHGKPRRPANGGGANVVRRWNLSLSLSPPQNGPWNCYGRKKGKKGGVRMGGKGGGGEGSLGCHCYNFEKRRVKRS